MNIVEEQDLTIARLTRLLEDRNEEIEELKKKLQKTEHQRSSFWAVLAGLGLNPGRGTDLAKMDPIEAHGVGRHIRSQIEARMKEETAFLRRRKALGFIGRVLHFGGQLG